MSTQYYPYRPVSVARQYPVQPTFSQPQAPTPHQPLSQKLPNGHYMCLYPQCANAGLFARHADLQRHVQNVHNPETIQWVDCQHPGCHRRGQYGFSRKDKMVEHMREVHKADIPKRSSGARSSG
ncbi:hypothetical protein LTR15_001090 [Elasticomyces elasticus]|nr:hypothetical protein LTR15_001090 [Elasticomyces elasticus]